MTTHLLIFVIIVGSIAGISFMYRLSKTISIDISDVQEKGQLDNIFYEKFSTDPICRKH